MSQSKSAPEDDAAPCGEPAPRSVRRRSLYEHTLHTALLAHLATAADPEGARKAFVAWNEAQEERLDQTLENVWHLVGRSLLAAGGDAAWRRLYLTEVAPRVDYAEGDEYRFLGMPVPSES